jgi:hypothetical protein
MAIVPIANSIIISFMPRPALLASPCHNARLQLTAGSFCQRSRFSADAGRGCYFLRDANSRRAFSSVSGSA